MTVRVSAVRPLLRLAAVLALAGGLAACSVDLPGQGPAPELYMLTPKSTFSKDLPTAEYQLTVETPITAASLDTNRIAVMKTPTNLDYYANATWIDRAPQMIQTLVIESFENTGRIVAVGRESVGLRADYTLKLEIREFQAQVFNADSPVVNVRINAKLVKMPERTIVGNSTFEKILPVPAGANLEEVIEVWDEALGKCLKRIVEWTLRTADRSERRAAS